jgi:4'-phosphopantetheinyl transferase
MAELWLVDLEAAAPALEALERDVPRLSAGDRERARRLRDPREQRHRLAVYMALRVALERIGGPQVRGQPIIRPPGGKPRLETGSPRFSVSHIDGLALIGVAEAHEIGVDLERTRRTAMSRRRREEILAAGAGLASRPAGDPDSAAALLQAWCRLEAFAKARGQGLSKVLGLLGLRQASGRQLPLTTIEASARQLARDWGVSVQDLRLPPELHGAIAGQDGTLPARPRSFPTEARAITRLLPRRQS